MYPVGNLINCDTSFNFDNIVQINIKTCHWGKKLHINVSLFKVNLKKILLHAYLK